MEKEPRKATEVLLELEQKINTLLNIVRNQDLNLKLLSNKLNSLLEKQDKEKSNKIIVEAVNNLPQAFVPEKNIAVSAEDALLLESSPKGFRRTSRPETFAGDNSFLQKNQATNTVTFPMQLPANVAAEVVVPDIATSNKIADKKEAAKNALKKPETTIPLIQRIVDKTGKSVFLADIEIINAENSESVTKTRTNGTGKWMTTLPLGNYKIFVRKRESLTKEKVETVQEIQVDGTKSPLELPMMILKI